MKARRYQPSDCARLEALHAQQGLDYELPEIDSPLMVVKAVVEDDAGQIVMAALGRLTCEVYLLADRSSGTPLSRWEGILALHRAAMGQAWRAGLEDAHCWVPPELERSFGRRLMRLGWTRPLWQSFALRIREPWGGFSAT